MAAYPSFLTLAESTATPANGLEPDRATNGRMALRRMWTADKMRFAIGHVLSAAQKTTLDTFYATNKDLDNTYKWPGTGVTYTVRFTQAPVYVPRTNGVYFEARVALEEV